MLGQPYVVSAKEYGTVIRLGVVLMSVSFITPVPVPAVLLIPTIVFLVQTQLTPSVGLIGL